MYRLIRFLILMVLALGLVACVAPSTPTPTLAPTEPPPPAAPSLPVGPGVEWQLTVIGDSTMWGLGRALEARIEQELGVAVTTQNYAVGALSAGQVLAALRGDQGARHDLDGLPAALATADIVVMWVNPEDSIDPAVPLDYDGCFSTTPAKVCSPQGFQRFTADLQTIWGEIFRLRAGRPTVLRATDCYNPIVSRWLHYGQFESCDACWTYQTDATRLAAEAYNIPFLSRYETWNGPDHQQDPREKGFIVSDGLHPSDRGCQYTAGLLMEMGFEIVTPP